MPKIDVKQIMQEVKDNQDKLKSCSRHSFDTDLQPGRIIGKRWECSQCGGVVDNTEKQWYEYGLQHGKNQDANPS